MFFLFNSLGATLYQNSYFNIDHPRISNIDLTWNHETHLYTTDGAVFVKGMHQPKFLFFTTSPTVVSGHNQDQLMSNPRISFLKMYVFIESTGFLKKV